MPNINPFGVFRTSEITEALETMPVMYGELRQMGLFRTKALTDHTVLIDEREGKLTVSEARPFGATGQDIDKKSRRVRTFAVPHFPHDTHVSNAETSSIRAFGSSQKEAAGQVLVDHLEGHKAKHDITIEYLYASAIQGITLDGSGNVLMNAWSEYGVTQEVFEIDTANDVQKLKKLFRDIARVQADALIGDVMRGSMLACSRELFDAIVDHPVVQKHYINHMGAVNWLQSDIRKQGFMIEGVKVWEYDAKAAMTGSDVLTDFIPANQGVAVPVGTLNTFRDYLAPSDFNEDVGKRGRAYYAKVESGEMNRGWKVHSQFNRLPLCLRPKSLVKVQIKA